MKNMLLVISTIILISGFTSCLKTETDRFECPSNKQATLTMRFNGGSIMHADDYTSGMVYCQLNGQNLQTIVDLGMLVNGENRSIVFRLDSIKSQNMIYTHKDLKESYIGMGNAKIPLVISELVFNVLEDSDLSLLTTFEAFDLASGTFEGKFLKPGDQDSTVVSGTFCYDEKPIPSQ